MIKIFDVVDLDSEQSPYNSSMDFSSQPLVIVVKQPTVFHAVLLALQLKILNTTTKKPHIFWLLDF